MHTPGKRGSEDEMGGNGLEIERKYLLDGAPSPADLAALGARATTIEQVYLVSADSWVRRVRRIEFDGSSRHVLTRKRDRSGIVREEIEVDVSPDEYERLAAEADLARRVIRKVRHVIPCGRWTLELDVFSDPPGLVLLEVELEDAADVPDLPPSIAARVVREVSTDPAYSNYRLALLADPAADPAEAGDPSASSLEPSAPNEPAWTRPALGGTRALMAPNRPDDDPSDDLPPTEAARARRRDRDAAAGARSGMRTGLAKQFKQVLDAQAKRARAALPRGRGGSAGDEDAVTEPPPKKRGHREHRPAPPG